jgi:hypothetical protein
MYKNKLIHGYQNGFAGYIIDSKGIPLALIRLNKSRFSVAITRNIPGCVLM